MRHRATPHYDGRQPGCNRLLIGLRVCIHEEQDVAARLADTRIPRGGDVSVCNIDDPDPALTRDLARAIGGGVIHDDHFIRPADLLGGSDKGIERSRHFSSLCAGMTNEIIFPSPLRPDVPCNVIYNLVSISGCLP